MSRMLRKECGRHNANCGHIGSGPHIGKREVLIAPLDANSMDHRSFYFLSLWGKACEGRVKSKDDSKVIRNKRNGCQKRHMRHVHWL